MEYKNNKNRIDGLIRFAIAITALNIIGQLFLGFEHSFLHLIVAWLSAYVLEMTMETVSSKFENRKPLFSGSLRNLIIFLLPGHIASTAICMLVFTNTDLRYIVFGVAVTILSKYIFKVRINGNMRHFLNPSNTGISSLFLLFPGQVGSIPPYQYTENLWGYGDILLCLFFIALGSYINLKYTKRMPVVLAWIAGFILQTVIRTSLADTATVSSLLIMTGPAFLLFSFYMVEDPGTTPYKVKHQIIFGLTVALIYGLLMYIHIPFNMFFALVATCCLRGIILFIKSLNDKRNTVLLTSGTL
ncbi:MAG: hypothetical protein LBQ22_00295 [Bacteroidales bacterium]|jgi:Na+-translocating ferredoxin:NAD+ oxidoreductase RnfD subunit|nr:hypothetical protein [Bacteroidales bacterium]